MLLIILLYYIGDMELFAGLNLPGSSYFFQIKIVYYKHTNYKVIKYNAM